MLAHYIHQCQCSADIVLIIIPRFFYTFAHSLQTCKVDTSIKLVVSENIFKSFTVANIHLKEWYLWNAYNLCNTTQSFWITVA